MKKFCAAGLLALLFTSCEYRFDVESSLKSPILYVESIVGLPGDADYIKVQKAVPSGMDPMPDDEYVITEFAVRQNDAGLPLERVRDTVFFYTHAGKIAGSKLDLHIGAHGLAEVSAVTEVPSKPVFEVECAAAGDERRWTLRLSDDGCEHYAVMLSPVYEYSDGSVVRGSSFDLSSDFGESSFDLIFPSVMEVNFTDFNDEYHLTMFDRGDTRGGSISFLSTDIADNKVEVIVFALSDEAYGYLKAKYNREHNVLGILGLSPPNFAYSNISGGYGVFGAVSYSQRIIEL